MGYSRTGFSFGHHFKRINPLSLGKVDVNIEAFMKCFVIEPAVIENNPSVKIKWGVDQETSLLCKCLHLVVGAL